MEGEYHAVYWGDDPTSKSKNNYQPLKPNKSSLRSSLRDLKGESGYMAFRDNVEDEESQNICRTEATSRFQDENMSNDFYRPNNTDTTHEIPPQQRTNRNSVFRTIMTTFDLVLLLVFCFVCSYTLFGFDTLVSLITTHYFNYTSSQTSLIFIIDGVLYAIVLIALVKLSTLFTDFHIIIFAVVVQLLGLIAVLTLNLYHTNIYFNYVSLSVFVVACSTTWCIEEVLTRSLFGKLVPSSCQSYAEGIRRSVSSVAFIISGVTTAGLFDYLLEISSMLIGATLLLLGVFVWRRETLENPSPLFHEENCELSQE